MESKKLKFWKWSAILLLVLNLALISIMLLKPGRHPIPPHEWVHFIADELDFSEAQKQKLSQLDQEHHKSIRGLMDDGRKLRNRFFEGLKQEQVTDSMILQGAKSIAANQQQIEMQTFRHFKRIRALCNQDQINKFDEIIFDALKRMGGPPPKK